MEASGVAGAATAWGSIDALLALPPEDVTCDSSWLSVALVWLSLPLILLQAILGAACKCVFRFYGAIVMRQLERGRPCWGAFSWWRFAFTTLLAFVFRGFSRLLLFQWEREAWGGGDHFFHGEGVWCCSYAEVEAVMRSEQPRVPAFGCISAVVPDLFPRKLLIFLPNRGPDSEWAAMRRGLHSLFLDLSGASWRERLASLPERLRGDWPTPKLRDLDDTTLVQRSVVKCIFYVMLGVWVSDGEADTLRGWRNLAKFFILPRILQRFLFNKGIRQVKQLRRDTVCLIEKHGLQEVFHKFNEGLPQEYRRQSVVALCDELMYAVGFAGIGGTCACVEFSGQMIQVKLAKENRKDRISFERYSTTEAMVAAYRADPMAYIKECCRLALPVTSVTSPLAEDRGPFKQGMLRQLVLSLANRDPAVFSDPAVFDPKRPDLNRALTWNGAFGVEGDEQAYPRLCPGRYLALEVAKTVLDHAVQSAHGAAQGQA